LHDGEQESLYNRDHSKADLWYIQNCYRVAVGHCGAVVTASQPFLLLIVKKPKSRLWQVVFSIKNLTCVIQFQSLLTGSALENN